MNTRLIQSILALSIVGVISLLVTADEGDAPAADVAEDAAAVAETVREDVKKVAEDAAGDAAAPAPEKSGAPSADDVINDLLKGSRKPIEPSDRPAQQVTPNAAGGVETGALDPDVVGVAPGGEQPKLRREGDFVINRRARMIRGQDTGKPMVVFESETRGGDAPMFLLPCQLLESMETIAQQRGEQVVFIVSGQITLYRDANYLLPTMMKVAVDGENLR